MAKSREPPRDPLEIEAELAEHLYGDTGIKIQKLRIDDRPQVLVRPDTDVIVDEIGAHLAQRDTELYQRAHHLVRVVQVKHKKFGQAPLVDGLTVASVREHITRHVACLAQKKDQWYPILPPKEAIAALLDRKHWPGVRHLAGISETPIFRPNGTICQDPGYDAETGYLFAPSCAFPHIPEHPTHDQMKAALRELVEPFSEFPYVNESHRMVAIAAILTMLARPAIDGSVPAFLFDASVRGAGKSLQCDCVALIATGRFAPRVAYPEEEELEKLLASMAIAGVRLIVLDNIKAGRPFGGSALDRCITAKDTVQLRVLGASVLKTLQWTATILASGNNLSLTGDMPRRVMVARIEPTVENPEARRFKRDLPTFIRAKRPALVAAALTILRGYAALGFPKHEAAQVMGGFETWSALIPAAIMWSGGADPMGARPEGDASIDDDARAHVTILERLPLLGQALTAREIITELYPGGRLPQTTDQHGDLREAIEQLVHTRTGTAPSAKALGAQLRRFTGKLVGQKRLAKELDQHAKIVRWSVVQLP